jgi:integrase
MNALPVGEFRRRVSALYAPPIRSRNTQSKMETVLKLVARAGIRSTDELSTENLARFVTSRASSVGVNTIRGDLLYLAAACKIAVEEGWLDRLPNWGRIRPRPAPAKVAFHSAEEIGRWLKSLEAGATSWRGARLLALGATVAYTGLRRMEALWLRREDVDVAQGTLAIVERAGRLKTLASAAVIPMPPELTRILGAWLPRIDEERRESCSGLWPPSCSWLIPGVRCEGPWTGGPKGDKAVDAIRRSGEAVGIQGLTLLSLRHSYASAAALRFGLTLYELCRMLRHTSPATQRWYVHVLDQDLVRAAARVVYPGGG